MALCLAWFRARSSFLAFLPDTGFNGPLVGYRTPLFRVSAEPRAFFSILFVALFFWTLARLAMRGCLLGTFGLLLEGISVEDLKLCA